MSPERSGARYCIVSPCRDEAEFMRRTLDSVTGQTVPPDLWVIVDDGSTDDTPKILAEYAARFPSIRIVRRDDRGKRSVGPGVIEAFYAGLETVPLADFDYVCKLDLDLDLPPRYFEILIGRMAAEPRLGTCSGKPYFIDPPTGRRVSERCGDETSVGMTKFYRRECFQEIGGFVREVMWDGIDCHRCRMLGWIACSWDEPDLQFIHLRPMGSSQKGILTGRMRHGFGQYFMGTGLLYMTASALSRAASRPWILGGLAMWWGYVWSLLRRKRRYGEPGFRSFLRRFQTACLLRGKRRATEQFDRKGEAVWSARRRGEPPVEEPEGVPLEGILLAAAAVRILWALLVPVEPVSDSLAYDTFARNLAAGQGYGWQPGEPSVYWPVGTSAIYAALYALFGTGTASIVVVNLLLGLGITALTVVVARREFGAGPARVAGWAIALWPGLIEFTTVLASELPFTFLVLLGVAAWRRPGWSAGLRGLLAGLAFAGASYVRPLALLLPLAMAAIDLVGEVRSWRSVAARTLLAGGVMGLAILPWTLRNERLFGRPVLISANGGANLWMGNHGGSSGEYERLPDWTRGMDEVSRDEALRREAMSAIRSHPAAFALRSAKKLAKLHDRETIGLVWNPGVKRRFGGGVESALKAASSLYWWAALALGLAGAGLLVFRAPFRRWAGSPSLVLWAYFAAIPAVTVVQDRYHLPFVPFIAALGGVAVSALLGRLGMDRAGRIG